MSQEKLITEILKLSEHGDWDVARKEWTLDRIQMSSYPKICLCGHYPIIELCYIHNVWTHHKTIVGNCCINRFFDMKTNNLFSSIKAIKKDNEHSPSKDLIDFAIAQHWVNDWEADFMQNTQLKRRLSESQIMQRERINAKILRRVWKE